MVSKDKELEKMVNDQEEEMEVGNTILKDASKKLQSAIKNKHFREMSVAQAMIEAAEAIIDSAREELNQTRKQQQNLSKRKQTIIDVENMAIKSLERPEYFQVKSSANYLYSPVL